MDFERAGYPLHVLFVCSAPIEERGELAEAGLDVDGVVNVLELMAGTDNGHVQAVARSTDGLTETAKALRALGFEVGAETLVRASRTSAVGGLDDVEC